MQVDNYLNSKLPEISTENLSSNPIIAFGDKSSGSNANRQDLFITYLMLVYAYLKPDLYTKEEKANQHTGLHKIHSNSEFKMSKKFPGIQEYSYPYKSLTISDEHTREHNQNKFKQLISGNKLGPTVAFSYDNMGDDKFFAILAAIRAIPGYRNEVTSLLFDSNKLILAGKLDLTDFPNLNFVGFAMNQDLSRNLIVRLPFNSKARVSAGFPVKIEYASCEAIVPYQPQKFALTLYKPFDFSALHDFEVIDSQQVQQDMQADGVQERSRFRFW